MLCICEAFSGNIHPSSSFQPRTPIPEPFRCPTAPHRQRQRQAHIKRLLVGLPCPFRPNGRGQLEWLEFGGTAARGIERKEARNCLCDIHNHVHIQVLGLAAAAPAILIACSISYGRPANAKTARWTHWPESELELALELELESELEVP